MAKEMYESAASHQVDGFYGFRISQNGTWDPVTDERISQLDKRVQGPATDLVLDLNGEVIGNTPIIRTFK